MATINMHMKFEIEIPKQTWLMLRKPCRLQTDGQTDRRTDKVNPVYPPSNFVGRGYNDTLFLKIVKKNWAIYCDFPVGSLTQRFARCRNFHFWPPPPHPPHPHTPTPTHTPHTPPHPLFHQIVRTESILMIGGLVFSFMAGQKCHISKIPFSQSEAKWPSGTFRKSIFFFHCFNPFIQLFWLRLNSCLMLIFFRPTQKVESMKIRPFLGQKSKWKKWPKMAKLTHVQRIIQIATLDIF